MPAPSNPMTAETPWSVALLAGTLKEYIERLGQVWIEGELLEWKPAQKGVFATIKDLERPDTLPLQVWRRDHPDAATDFKQGDRVLVHGRISFWAARGTISVTVLEIRHVGLGDLFERLERLRRQLAEEGLFDPARKTPLPFLPQCIGLVTGKDSDAEKDVLRNSELRWPGVRFKIRHVLVQGEQSPPQVVAAIEQLDLDPEVDVIVVARGGGSFQDLLGFSDERVVRAAAACETPLVSAIGHENDHPILDDVADLRASTPTDAAKRIVPDVAEERARVAQARARLANRLSGYLTMEIDRIGQLRTRPVLSDGRWIVDSRVEDVYRWTQRGAELVDRRLQQSGLEISHLTTRLRALSPAATLERGYAIARRPDGRVLRTSGDAASGDRLRVLLADGELQTTVD